MSILLHYPSSIIRYFVRLFNQVNKNQVLAVENETRLVIRHRAADLKKPELLVSLDAQLTKAMKTITEKYLDQKRLWSPINVRMVADERHLIIKIDGIHLIPPRKIINLMDLILWYSFTARKGIRPNDDPEGRILTENWRSFQKVVFSKFERAKRRYEFVDDPLKCTTCAKPTVTLVCMQISIGNEIIDHKIPVCDRHKLTTL